MKALVLAAGLGERVRPLTDTTPKPMLEVGGRPLIHYPLLMLKRGGVTTVIINVHHLAEKIEGSLRDGSDLGLEIIYSPEPVLFGTGGPLSALRDFLGDDTFLIANSDSIMDLDVAGMVRFHRSRGALVTLALRPANDCETYSRVETDAESRIRRMRILKSRRPLAFDDYPPDLKDPEAASLEANMYCGLMVAEPSVLALAPKSPPWSLMTGLVAPMVKRGLPVFGFRHQGYFRTVDDLQSYQALVSEFAACPPGLAYLGRE